MKVIASLLMILSLAACLPGKEEPPSTEMKNLGKCANCAISKPILEE